MKVKEKSEKSVLKLNIQKTKIMASWQGLFWGAPESLQMVTAAMKFKDTCCLEEKLYQPRQHIKKQRHFFANKDLSSQGYYFSSCPVWIWELDYKESWAPKNWCFWTVVLEKTLESTLDSKEIQPVRPKASQSWIFIGRTDAEAELTHLKRPWCWERLKTGGKGTTEDEMVVWHYWLDGREFDQAPGVGDGQESLECCSPWGWKETDTTEWLNWTELDWLLVFGLITMSLSSQV